MPTKTDTCPSTVWEEPNRHPDQGDARRHRVAEVSANIPPRKRASHLRHCNYYHPNRTTFMKFNMKYQWIVLAISLSVFQFGPNHIGSWSAAPTAQAQSTALLQNCQVSDSFQPIFEKARRLVVKNNGSREAFLNQGTLIICQEFPDKEHEPGLKLLVSAFVAPNSVAIIDELWILSGKNKRLENYFAEIGKTWNENLHGKTGIEVNAFVWTSNKVLDAIGMPRSR